MTNAISITAQRLKSEFIPQKDKEEYVSFTKLILDEIKRLDNIINQFLGLAKAQKLNLVPTAMESYLNQLVDLIRMEANQKGIAVNADIDILPEVRIDREEMKKALLNIMLNAIQATDSNGKLLIRSHSTDDNRTVIIEIEDSGKGIPKEKLSRIFQPYFSTKERGTGLGLYICDQIIQAHNGSIDVQSTINKGTTFNIYLPPAEVPTLEEEVKNG